MWKCHRSTSTYVGIVRGDKYDQWSIGSLVSPSVAVTVGDGGVISLGGAVTVNSS